MTGLWWFFTQGPVKVIGIRRGNQLRACCCLCLSEKRFTLFRHMQSSLCGLGLLDESGKGGLISHGEIG